MRVTERGLEEVISEFEMAGAKMPEGSKAVVSKALLNIKVDWRRQWAGKFDHAPRIHKSINYDFTSSGPLIISGEVGPEDEPVFQGFLGRILEFGGLHSGPHPGGIPAAERESPKFEAAVNVLMRKLFP
jgi:hypothetical protein